MPFRFALASILNLRRSQERQRLLSLQQAVAILSGVQSQLEHLETYLAKSAVEDAHRLTAGLTGADLHFAESVRARFESRRAHLVAQICEKELLRDTALAAYRKASADRQILEALETKQRSAFLQEQARREQQHIDASYLFHRWKRG